MTLYESDVEFFHTFDDSGVVAEYVWDDDDFQELIGDYGLERSLEMLTEFHANLSSQLKMRGVSSPQDSDWARRTISLTSRTRARRQQVRALLRASGKEDFVAEVTARVKADWSD